MVCIVRRHEEPSVVDQSNSIDSDMETDAEVRASDAVNDAAVSGMSRKAKSKRNRDADLK